MARKAINEGPGLPKALGPYSRAVWAADTLYVSGATGVDPETGKLVEGGVGAQAERVLKNLELVLNAAGLTFDHVVKALVFLTDINDFAAMNKVYEGYFEEPRPARSTVAVKALPGGAAVEIELVAARS